MNTFFLIIFECYDRIKYTFLKINKQRFFLIMGKNCNYIIYLLLIIRLIALI